MTRSSFILGICMIGLSAYSVFHIKYQVKELTRDIVQLNRQIADDKEAIHVLKAEWAYLTQPARLKVLAEQYLELNYIAANQIMPVNGKLLAESMPIYSSKTYSMDVMPTMKPILSSIKSYD